MKKIYHSDDVVLAGYLHAVLTSKGIACMQRNAFLSGAAGELPPNECWVELWLVDARDSESAQALLEALLHNTGSPSANWACHHCNEQHPGQFTACWNCGAEKP